MAEHTRILDVIIDEEGDAHLTKTSRTHIIDNVVPSSLMFCCFRFSLVIICFDHQEFRGTIGLAFVVFGLEGLLVPRVIDRCDR